MFLKLALKASKRGESRAPKNKQEKEQRAKNKRSGDNKTTRGIYVLQ